MKINSLSKAQLAQLYAPDLAPISAVNRLMKWLKRDEGVMQQLAALGYSKCNKVFTARQVQVIIDYLGEP